MQSPPLLYSADAHGPPCETNVEISTGQHWGIKLTPCLQACSLSARTQARCQFSRNVLKENNDDSKPFSAAPESPPPTSRPKRSFCSDPQMPPTLIWSHDGLSRSFWPTGFELWARSTVREYWTSQVMTISREVRNRVTRIIQLISCRSITAGGFHIFQRSTLLWGKGEIIWMSETLPWCLHTTLYVS